MRSRQSVVLLVLSALAALAVLAPGAAAARAATLVRPIAKDPQGTIRRVQPDFRWSKVTGASTYEVRVHQGSTTLLRVTGITGRSWTSSTALPQFASLTWQVRARSAAGAAGPWSKPRTFTITVDYSRPSLWLSRPAKVDRKVDVFYLYPSSYVKPNPNAPNVCKIDDAGMVRGARAAFSRQATAFRTLANIYAPFYSQADAGYALSLPPAQRNKLIGGIPAHDAIAAFSYYIRHFNHGRPFILASHSQGSQVMEFLLAQYMKAHPDVYKRMIVAYVVGYSVTPSYLAQHPFLKFAKGPNDTGVIASWNTEAPTIAAPNPVLLPGGLVINPITWTRKQTEATAAQNRGSIELNPATGGTPFLNKNGSIKRVRNLADARIDKAKGVVICSTIDASRPPYFTPGGFPMGVLHTFDYPLYFFNVRANAAARVAHYFAEN